MTVQHESKSPAREDPPGAIAGRQHRGGGRDWALVLALALLVRLAVWPQYRFEGMDCDGAAYYNLARHFASGHGWTGYSLRFLFSLPATVPMPDYYWSPLLPFLLAGSFSLFGISFAAAKLVTVLLGCTIPVLVYLLARELSGSRRAAIFAGSLAAIHPTMVDWSLRMLTEIGSMSLVTLVFVLVLVDRWRARTWVVGAAAGLAYLFKYQNILVWPALLLADLLFSPRRGRVKRIVWALAGFAVVIAPWIVRNLLVFGNPTYTIASSMAVSGYPRFGGSLRLFSSLTPPPGLLEILRSHPSEVAAQTWVGMRVLPVYFFRSFAGTAWLYPAVLLGAVAAVARPRRWAPLALYVACLYMATSVAVPQGRFLLSLLPIWLAVAGIGFDRALVWARSGPVRWGTPLRWGIAVVFVLAAGTSLMQVRGRVIDRVSPWVPGANFCALEYEAIADAIGPIADPGEPMFVEEPYHGALVLDRVAVQIPLDEATLRTVRDRYQIRFLAATERDLVKRLPAWVSDPPDWARLVLRVPAAEIPRPAEYDGGRHLGDILVFRVDESATGGP